MKGREYIDEISIKQETNERTEEVVTRSEESFVDHPFVQQLQELDFKTADITAAMQVFKSKEDPSTLKEINRQLKEKLLCVRSKTNDVTMFFASCGHRITCETSTQQFDYCPHCNKVTTKRIKTFLS